VKVVTIATDLENPFLQRLLIPSCIAVGLDLVVLCPTTQPARRRSVRTPLSYGLTAAMLNRMPFNFADKRVVLSRYLSQLCDREELIVFTDAYDTLFVRGETHIGAAHAAFAEPVVFSAELNSWPLGVVGLALYDGPPPGPYSYLNSGGFVGAARDILDLMVRYPDPPSARFEVLGRLRAHGYDTDALFGWSDQYYWTLVHLLEPAGVVLDHRARLFECYGKPYPDVGDAVRDSLELRGRGADAVCYRRERRRLLERLQTPGAAAQVHFSSAVTKAAALDLFEDGQLPGWITQVLDAPAGRGTVQVQRI
jgi:hypothetical protein